MVYNSSTRPERPLDEARLGRTGSIPVLAFCGSDNRGRTSGEMRFNSSRSGFVYWKMFRTSVCKTDAPNMCGGQAGGSIPSSSIDRWRNW